MNKNPICCICGKLCENTFGNNPYPISSGEKDRCCDECNQTYVIPARLYRLYAGSAAKKQEKGDATDGKDEE